MPAYNYHERRNPNGRFIIGVPLRSLSADEFAALNHGQQKAVAKAPFYSEVEIKKPQPKAAAATPDKATAKKGANKK